MLDALLHLFCRGKRKMASRSIYRNISVFRPLMDSLREPMSPGMAAAIHEGTSELWKKIFLFGCIPSLVLCSIHVMLNEEHGRPEFKPYEHLRLRTRRFPWGDGNHTLFHNPHTNALPDGYEE